MTITRRLGLLLVLFSAGIFIVWGSALERTAPGAMTDFKAVYYGSRCLLQHTDPYQESEFLDVYQADGGEFPSDPVVSRLFHRGLLLCVNLPAAMLLIAPLALLPWGIAHLLWMTLTAACLTLAACLQWNAGMSRARGVSLFLVCLLLANTEVLFALGNTAGIVAGLCVVAAWCFLRERFAVAGVLCLAIGLAIKPQDAGPVWLCFLLLGGTFRKRAWQTLAGAVLIALPSVLWVTQVSPHWMVELRSNLAATSVRGDINDPGPESLTARTADQIIDLQSVVSVFRDDPHIYNWATYLVCAPLILTWAFLTLKSRPSPENAWIGLAAITTLSLVVSYHRLYDAKLLLLTVPACALLWAEGGLVRWFALVLNTAAIGFTGDIPSLLLWNLTANVRTSAGDPWGRMLAAVSTRPIPIILLALGIFYLWALLRRTTSLCAEGGVASPESAAILKSVNILEREGDCT